MFGIKLSQWINFYAPPLLLLVIFGCSILLCMRPAIRGAALAFAAGSLAQLLALLPPALGMLFKNGVFDLRNPDSFLIDWLPIAQVAGWVYVAMFCLGFLLLFLKVRAISAARRGA